MKESTLFAKLPEYVSTPDGMAIDKDGNLILACPNYAIANMPGCILKIDKDKGITYVDSDGNYAYIEESYSLVPIDNLVNAFIWLAENDWMYAVDEEFNSLPEMMK